MSYSMYFAIKTDRIRKSLEAYNKFKEKHAGLSAEELDAKVDELRRKFDMKTEPALYWWSVKVINGHMYTVSNGTKLFWT